MHSYWIFSFSREYRVSPWTYGVSAGVVRQPGDWWLPVHTSDVPVSAAAHVTRATISICAITAEVGNAMGTGFPTPPHAATWC